MMRWLIVTALAVYVLSVVGLAIAPAEPKKARNAKSAPPAAPSASTQPPAQLMVGFALNFHHTEDPKAFIQAIDQIVELGGNTVEVLTPCFQEHGASEDIRVVVGPGRSPKREHLVQVLKHARSRGLTTVLMPLVLFENPRGNEWRGKIQPERWDNWWKAYRRNFEYFLDLAIECDVSVLSVGSELLSTEKQTDRWEEHIAYVRSRFPGRLSYSTNWDHYHTPTFWSKLDMIGISCYWDMTKLATKKPPEGPEPEALAKRWEQIQGQVLAFGQTQGKPIFLTEIGYPSLPWGLKDPWNYVNSDNIKSDERPQLLGYQAFLSAWDDLLVESPKTSRFTGVCFYEWDVYNAGGPSDTGYGVRGKPTYDLLKQFFARQHAAAKR
jgi:hypothetical protein